MPLFFVLVLCVDTHDPQHLFFPFTPGRSGKDLLLYRFSGAEMMPGGWVGGHNQRGHFDQPFQWCNLLWKLFSWFVAQGSLSYDGSDLPPSPQSADHRCFWGDISTGSLAPWLWELLLIGILQGKAHSLSLCFRGPLKGFSAVFCTYLNLFTSRQPLWYRISSPIQPRRYTAENTISKLIKSCIT